MEKSEEALEKLKVAVNGGREFLERSGTLPPEYVADSVYAALREVLEYLIEERHKVDESENGKDNLVIHYTSVAVLVSMLQGASKDNEEHREKEEKEFEPESMSGDKKSSLRLYDSVHLNDPDEGNYFDRNSNLPKKYGWLGEKEGTHAYITSFIIPNSKKDMSNNLVFWRTYGDEGMGCSLSLPVSRGWLRKVLYGAKEVKRTVKILNPVLQALDPLVKACKEPLRKDVSEKLAEIFWEALEKFRYLYKSEAYEYENECRFVIAESDIQDKDKIFFEDQKLNNSPIRIRHYCEHEELDTMKLLATGSSIMLGPRVPHADNVCYYINTLRQRAGLAHQKIKISKIPYRKF